jgi:two-component system, OmpR family, sensor histidine kinase KdpD
LTSSRTVGVLGLRPGPELSVADQEQMHALESFANQTAMAIERALLAREAHRAFLKAQTEALRSTFLRSLSDDLQTPLAAITEGAAALLRTDLSTDQQIRRKLYQGIQDEAEHLSKIIRDVLDMTRIEAKAVNAKIGRQPFNKIVATVLDRLSERFKNRKVTVNIPKDLPLIPLDPLLIERVFANLLDNAIKYTPQGTPLDLSAKIKGEALLVEVADRGPGISPGDEERIFEKFVRTSEGGGIGLGLTISRAIIEAHGGRIWAENRPGGGAIFHFTLPLQRQEQVSGAAFDEK